MRFSIAILAFLFLTRTGRCQADDWQLWGDGMWQQNLGNALVVNFRSELRFERDFGYPAYYELEPSLTFRYSPRWDFFAGYERDERFRPNEEVMHVPNFGAVLKVPIKKWDFSNRSRLDVVVPESSAEIKTDVVFRNLFNVNYKWDVGGKQWMPFLFDEVFVSANQRDLSENRFGIGLQIPIVSHWSTQVYWLKQDIWRENNSEWHPILGLTLQTQF